MFLLFGTLTSVLIQQRELFISWFMYHFNESVDDTLRDVSEEIGICYWRVTIYIYNIRRNAIEEGGKLIAKREKIELAARSELSIKHNIIEILDRSELD